ncbi:uncharacterized protein EV154DRAFT_494467 [Mucor mucedo]|uniref:uncharacterized protein n=1 Tax=Mucor mucedo TaxID=29922 RepID=UPI00221E5290|nr:uncharacterized protein EV154DRAFT_494467 [Mucor mucedo]KAI7895644.1 hypothetical protein EV154DRAFT_494467 [Mucor mucedo]
MKVFDYNTYDFIVSIDFGTTYSGCCYIDTSGKTMKAAIENDQYDVIIDGVRNIDTWESADKNKVKVPTVAVYSRRNKTLIEWGFEAYRTWKGISAGFTDDETQTRKEEDIKGQKSIILQKFKLNIAASRTNNNEEDNHDDDYLSVMATIDYLRNMNDTAFNMIVKNFFTDVDKSKIRYVLTVPAQWTDDERVAMRMMATDAGIITKTDHENKLIIINESFAATLFCEKELASKCFAFEEGAKYLICDAGGGTVDLATYESTIISSKDKNSIGRCQLTTDSGDKCGSGFVDDHMENLLLDLLFHGCNQIDKARNKIWLASLMAHFIENLKPEFDDDELETVFDLDLVGLHNSDYQLKPCDEGNEEYEIREDDECNYSELVIPNIIMCKYVFDPVVNATLRLIDNQIQKANSSEIQAIFLLGGFGESRYLLKRANICFQDKVKEIISCENGDRAAMRGAIYFGIDGIQRSHHDKSIISRNFKDKKFDPESFDVLICIDIGYEFSTCGYFVNMGNKQTYLDLDLIRVEEESLPGRCHEKPYKIPTVLEYSKHGAVKWGAQVDPHSCDRISLSHLMSTSKDDFEKFIVDYLERIHEYACRVIQKRYTLFSRGQFRYCLTMENCFNFFTNKAKMAEFAVAAKVLRVEGDEPIMNKRLLLINREDASAMFYEKMYYTENNSYFWTIKIDMEENICLLSCHEIRNADASVLDFVPTEENLYDSKRSGIIDSGELQFDFSEKLVSTLKYFKLGNNSSMHYGNYGKNSCNQSLKEAFKNLIEEEEIMEREGNTLITFTNGCCEYTCTKEQVVDYIVQPTILDFVDQTCKFVVNRERIPQKITIDNIYIVRRQEETTEFKHRIVNSLADCLKEQLGKIFGKQCRIQALSSLNDSQAPQTETGYRPVVRVRENVDKEYIYHFLQIIVQRNCFHLNLHETTSISGDNERTYQNVRKLRSSTFEFDFNSALIKQVYDYIRQKPRNYFCQKKASHRRRTQKYDNALTKGLLYFIKNNLTLEKNKATEPIYIDDCCTIQIEPHDCLVSILKPALIELLETTIMHMIQSGITRDYTGFHNLFFFGTLVEATDDGNNFIKTFIKGWMYDSLPGMLKTKDNILFTICDNNEVINGAAMYGLDTTLYMERISRRTYAISVQAHPFLIDSQTAMPLANTKENTSVHFQSQKESSETNKIDPTTKIKLIKQNDKITMDMQSIGKFERFFVDQDCIVYATIFAKEDSYEEVEDSGKDLNEGIEEEEEVDAGGEFEEEEVEEVDEDKDEDKIGIEEGSSNKNDYKKIHQFEICLKRQHGDINNTSIRSRLSFEIRLMFPSKNEAKFEVNIGQSKESNIPKFEFRDEILVTNIY